MIMSKNFKQREDELHFKRLNYVHPARFSGSHLRREPILFVPDDTVENVVIRVPHLNRHINKHRRCI